MRTRRHPSLLLGPLLWFLPLVAFAQERRVDYTVSLPDSSVETFSVTAEVHGLPLDTFRFAFSSWTPGTYDIVHYGRHVFAMEARDESGREQTVMRVDTGVYLIIATASHLTISYRVLDIEQLSHTVQPGLSDIEWERSTAFANGPALFGCADGFAGAPHTVTYRPPAGWDVAVPLTEIDGGVDGRRTFGAESYHELIDAPLLMGLFRSLSFDVAGIPHTVAIAGTTSDTIAAMLTATTKRGVEIVTALFDTLPYDRYLFQYVIIPPHPFVPQITLGLGHAGCSTHFLRMTEEEAGSRPSIPADLLASVTRNHLSAWSPGRFGDTALRPDDYRLPPETESLWFHEGVMVYLARQLMLREGVTPPGDYLTSLNIGLSPYYSRSPGAPITALSRMLPYRHTYAFEYFSSDAAALAFLLDAEIRVQTGNRRSLGDAIRHFGAEYDHRRGGKRFGEDDIIPIIEEATGAELTDFHRDYIDGTVSLPLDELMHAVGIDMEIEPYAGAGYRKVREGWEITDTTRGGIVAASGLGPLDTIVAVIDDATGVSTSAKKMSTAFDMNGLLTKWEGRAATIRFIRNGRRWDNPLFIRFRIKRLTPSDVASELAREIRKSMMGI